MANKNTAKETRKTRKNFSLITFIYAMFLLAIVILFVFNTATAYKTYADSEIVKANVINVYGTKNGMLDVKYRYNYDGDKYEESVKQSVGEIKVGDKKEIRIRKNAPEQIITTSIKSAIFNNTICFFGIMPVIVMMYGLTLTIVEKCSGIEI